MIRTLFAALAFAATASAAPPTPAGPLTKIFFGSCADQNKPCPIWDKVIDAKPDLGILLGDNIYADLDDGKLKPADPAKIAKSYADLAKLPAWQKLKETTPLLATWDDHDYGHNDAGAEWPHKDAAQKLFLDFFDVPADSPRRARKGVYHSEVFGPEGKRVQVIMLDMRYFRGPYKRAEKVIPGTRIRPYLPNNDDGVTVLGEEQWKWFEEQLKVPAEIRLIGSSVQLVSEEQPFEKWMNFPNETKRFYQLIKDTGAKGVVVLSGDRHWGEISVEPKAAGYPILDITSSGLNQAEEHWRDTVFGETDKNAKRIAVMPSGQNFGMVLIDWNKPDPVISLQLRGEDGEIVAQIKADLSRLQPGAPKKGAKAEAPKENQPLAEGVLTPAEALKKKEGEEVTVQFEVMAGRLTGKRILLNSEKDFKSDKNFTVVVNDKAWTGKFDKATYDTFKGKTIKAKGKLSSFNGSLQIQISDEKDLEIVEAKKD
jgi:alkaline phosphatase D